MLIPAEVFTIAQTDQGDAVLIKPLDANVVVPIIIGSPEADSILLGIKKIKIPRPLTHDLLISTLNTLKIKIERIEITELNKNTFYARLVLNQNSAEISIDSRPSDSIAIAVRVHCPIYIDEHIVEEVGVPINFIDNLEDEQENRLNSLKEKLSYAIEDENYEEAAIIRDQIIELEQKVK